MNAYEKIRAALEQAGDYIRSDLASERGAFEGHEGVSRIDEIKADLASNAAALAALAELEKAASEVVAWIIGKPTHGHDIGRYLVWNAGHVPHSVGGAAEPLYAAPPVPAGMFTAEQMRAAYDEGQSNKYGPWLYSDTFKLIQERTK